MTVGYVLPHCPYIAPKRLFEEYFDKIQSGEGNGLDLIFGNSNLKKEKTFNNVIHRIIGENPDLNIKAFITAHIIKNQIDCLIGTNKISRK